jgi:hypothetical protein
MLFFSQQQRQRIFALLCVKHHHGHWRGWGGGGGRETDKNKTPNKEGRSRARFVRNSADEKKTARKKTKGGEGWASSSGHRHRRQALP